MFKTQAKKLRDVNQAYPIRELSALTGIGRMRLHRLINGTVELTLREAYSISKATPYNLLTEEFMGFHFYDAPMRARPSKSEL